jgi:hypothetical protein
MRADKPKPIIHAGGRATGQNAGIHRLTLERRLHETTHRYADTPPRTSSASPTRKHEVDLGEMETPNPDIPREALRNPRGPRCPAKCG